MNDLLKEMIGYVTETRRYGVTYVKAGFRSSIKERWNCLPTANINGQSVTLSFCGWGKSLEVGGHKYKAHARYRETQKPVPSKLLGLITA